MWQRQSLVGMVDRIGIIASAACFVHCVGAPIVLSLMAVYAHLLPAEETTHRVLAILVTILGAVAILSGYQKHKRRSILALMALGLALISTGALFGDRLPSHWLEVAITLAGSICMITAHRQNHTFCKQCTACT
ncbi:MerC domain-containing protein [Granulicella sp. WH15]|nr:MerC domain-containing protein [Granulicella sp. WH15]